MITNNGINVTCVGIIMEARYSLKIPSAPGKRSFVMAKAAMEEDWSQAEKRLLEAYDDWDSSQGFFHTIMNHSDLDEAESLFAGAKAVCSQQDDADFHLLLAQLMEQMDLLAETQSVSIKNIL